MASAGLCPDKKRFNLTSPMCQNESGTSLTLARRELIRGALALVLSVAALPFPLEKRKGICSP